MYAKFLYHTKIYKVLKGAPARAKISSQNSVAHKWLTQEFFCSV